MEEKLLNNKYINDLREVINRTNIFMEDEQENSRFNLICAIMDRFDTSVKYINDHNYMPKNEDETILIIIHLCIIKDGINSVYKVLNMDLPITNYFRNLCCKIFNMTYEEYKEYGSDDKFFQYIRCLTFAHPFITTNAIPKHKSKEIHYSPYILNNSFKSRINGKSTIGFMVYSNNVKEMFSVDVEFSLIKEYIKAKYDCIQEIISAFNSIIEEKEKNWKKRKVNRIGNPIGMLNDILDILKERYIDGIESIEELINYLECDSSISSNDKLITDFKNRIIDIIPNLCDCIDNMDYEEMHNIIRNIYLHPKKAHKMMHYQLEKIFDHLNEKHKGNIEFGLKQADDFSKEFAKKYVKIDTQNMSFTEIKMLVNIACYLEYQEQNKEKDK